MLGLVATHGFLFIDLLFDPCMFCQRAIFRDIVSVYLNLCRKDTSQGFCRMGFVVE